MKAINRKLLRDIGNMAGAVFTITLVVAAGIAAFVTLRGTYDSIVDTRDRYYSQRRFGDVFARLERAPLSYVDRFEDIDGVTRVYPHVVGEARLPLDVLSEPASARIVSLPDDGEPPLNNLVLMAGRLPSNDRDDEAVLLEHFADTHDIEPGSSLKVIVEGRQRTLRIVGIVMSPEYVLAIPDGASAPSPERFAVLWMPRRAVEAAYDMEGCFNALTLAVAPNADSEKVLAKVDELLDRYGGLGATKRERQVSNYFLTQDLGQLATMGTIAPLIFLGVAAFLLNVVLSRLIELDRPQIATLKAIGYTNREVGLHYFELTLIITLLGAVIGIALGAWLGGHMTNIYVTFYRMPSLAFQMDLDLAVTALIVSFTAGVTGSLISVRRVMQLPPAEAMRPAAPPSYRQGAVGRAITRQLDTAARMVAREISRRPMRTALSAVGIGAATGIIVVGQFFSDAMAYIVDVWLQNQQRETIAVAFANPVPAGAVRALKSYPGVVDVQWRTTLQVRVRAGHRERIVPLVAHSERHSMRPLLDDDGNEVPLERGSVLFTDMLATVLGVSPGDQVMVEPIQGDRTPRTLTMTGTLPELMALWVHMPASDFERWLGVAPMVTEAMLTVDSGQIERLEKELLDIPQVVTAIRKELIIRDFRRQQGETLRTFAFVLTLFAMVIAVSVVYNNARVALSLRGRELASLRVLGFTRGEISSVLIGELGVQVLLGMPVGLWFGKWLVHGMMAANDPEGFRFPMVITDRAYAFAAMVTVLAAVASALLVRRKLDRLDLIEVLKTRE